MNNCPNAMHRYLGQTIDMESVLFNSSGGKSDIRLFWDKFEIILLIATKLTISNSVHFYESSSDFMLQYAVKGEYRNFRGAWLNDTYFLVAKRFFTDRTHFKLEAHEVCEFNHHSFQIRPTHILSLLFLGCHITKTNKRWDFLIQIFKTCKYRANIWGE